jgi:GT2 family glycosyltransferase
MTIRSWAVDRVGTFNEALPIYADEFEWQWRLLDDGGKIAYVADAWLWHCKTANTLRVVNLIRNRFKRGKNRIELDRHVGAELLAGRELRLMLRALGHAIKRQCTWGILAASERAGRAWGVLHVK